MPVQQRVSPLPWAWHCVRCWGYNGEPRCRARFGEIEGTVEDMGNGQGKLVR